MCIRDRSCVAANYHILYMGKKASSSSQTPPPLAHEMLLIITPIYPVPGTGQADMTFFQQPIICIGTKTVGEMFAVLNFY